MFKKILIQIQTFHHIRRIRQTPVATQLLALHVEEMVKRLQRCIMPSLHLKVFT